MLSKLALALLAVSQTLAGPLDAYVYKPGDLKNLGIERIPGLAPRTAFNGTVSLAPRAPSRTFIDFSGKRPGENAVDFLNQYNFRVSTDTIAAPPITRKFFTENVYFGQGVLNLRVSAYNGNGVIGSAQIHSRSYSRYGSFRVVSRSSRQGGVCEGNFFYLNDNQEVDWEMLTSTIDRSSACVPAGIWATNQATTPGGQKNSAVVPLPWDPRAGFHEYRVDWTAQATTFYLDGVQKARFTTNVPTAELLFITEAWSSGDPCWSNGPPTGDSVTEIRSIDLYQGYVP
ncbi:concanavalin A-like lectin/glucanase domain-containing protein [Pterulicium gracile]|uniref:Concanavalin A-like lectin/glucanase domain-containing protein n=1 Tax=Pterulicium gracile TaxID=1884261 RepID=A0A5C3Q8I2_9AGAR|nr:concanavalin A-like lectin/glucanase domain-containing protein [Pterula gracilis]